MKSAEEIQLNMAHACGTVRYHRMSPLHSKLVATDGVFQLCEDADAYWLMDAIASHQPQCMKDGDLQYMQFWELVKQEDGSWLLSCDRDKDDNFLTQKIEYSDFPLDSVKIWVERGFVDSKFVMVAMLPSER